MSEIIIIASVITIAVTAWLSIAVYYAKKDMKKQNHIKYRDDVL